jgi:hypothetical protein
MSLKITLIQKDGDAKKEYLFLQATADVNLHDYVIVDRTYSKDGKVSDIHKHFYRFPVHQVKKGEYVSLRTGKGSHLMTKTEQGVPIHRFYWGSDAPFWNDSKIEKAEILKVATVDSKAA